ncbi:hypothetical protein TNIN_456651 [Trichonephila inaurata madagascariensis]|uniref:Uncharacterized protein n=1 Tax=Trichonephila inaurata madagascariensis TaxID=2747483 RepID=A0A8X7CL62_9ARAC|nr:hypothetical protein TNIN_456651 [Trichonephila inaurata madagascariensis]
MYRLGPHQSHLGNEHQAQGSSGTEHDENGNNDEGRVLLFSENKRERGPNNAHYDDVVDAHTDVLGIVEGRDADVPCFPGEKTTKGLIKRK